jgi:hypothetical protein
LEFPEIDPDASRKPSVWTRVKQCENSRDIAERSPGGNGSEKMPAVQDLTKRRARSQRSLNRSDA